MKEDLGDQPQIVVRDAKGVSGCEAGYRGPAGSGASPLVWAAGYSVDEDYFASEIHVTGLPAHLHRGQKFKDEKDNFHDARLKRQSNRGEKAGRWKWRQNPFVGTREFNGLRTLVAVINDWDVKDVNTAIRDEEAEQADNSVFSDQRSGASFESGRREPTVEIKGDLASTNLCLYPEDEPEFVDFKPPGVPGSPFNPHVFFRRPRERCGAAAHGREAGTGARP